MNLTRRSLFVLLVLSVATTALAQANPSPAGHDKAQAPDFSVLNGSSTFTFVAYGDIRFTSPANTRVSNPAERDALVDRIAELKPAFLVITGDLVLKGANEDDWRVWEAETEPWREAQVKVFPVLGNHDVADDPQATHFFAHLPELNQRRWYSVRAGNVLLLMLDSTSDLAGGPQSVWLAERLAAVPSDVDFVVVALHHPPYTHSSPLTVGGGHTARPNEEKLAQLLEQRQSTMHARLLVLAGHVHNYERYEHGGVMYVVTGGGGATPYRITRSPQDLYHEPGATYHFMRFSVEGPKLRAEMIRVESRPGKTAETIKDSFQLESAAASTATSH